MKKYFAIMGIAFVIICSVIVVNANNVNADANTERELSYEDIAEAYMLHEHPEFIYDEIVVGETTEDEYSNLTTIIIYNEGKVAHVAHIDMSYYGNLLF